MPRLAYVGSVEVSAAAARFPATIRRSCRRWTGTSCGVIARAGSRSARTACHTRTSPSSRTTSFGTTYGAVVALTALSLVPVLALAASVFALALGVGLLASLPILIGSALELPFGLVAGHGRRTPRRQVALGQVQVGAAHAARAHTQQHMARSHARVSHIDDL